MFSKTQYILQDILRGSTDFKLSTSDLRGGEQRSVIESSGSRGGGEHAWELSLF